MKKYKYILPLLALFAASCEKDDVLNSANEVTLNLNLAIPVEMPDSRTLGDPGIDEAFQAPTVLWLFLACDQYDFHQVYSAKINTTDADWSLSSDNKTFYYSDNRLCSFDGLDLSKNPDIRAYLVASHDAFSFVQELVPPSTDEVKGKTLPITIQTIDENMLTHLQIYAKYATGYINLRDIYSTPYNLTTNWDDKNVNGGTYYGTVDKEFYEVGMINVSDTLYHVAAKADFQWNPETSNFQPNVAKSIVLNNLPSYGYVFRPTENPSSATKYTKLLLGNASANDTSDATEVNAGNQWSGRAYTFMFQPANGVLNYTFTTKNNEAAGGYQGVADPADVVNSSNSGVFASWYKVDHNIADSTIE